MIYGHTEDLPAEGNESTELCPQRHASGVPWAGCPHTTKSQTRRSQVTPLLIPLKGIEDIGTPTNGTPEGTRNNRGPKDP